MKTESVVEEPLLWFISGSHAKADAKKLILTNRRRHGDGLCQVNRAAPTSCRPRHPRMARH